MAQLATQRLLEESFHVFASVFDCRIELDGRYVVFNRLLFGLLVVALDAQCCVTAMLAVLA